MHYDELLRSLGEFGRYQRYQYLLVCLVALVSSFHAMNMVFVGPIPKHRCRLEKMPPQWSNLTNEQCHTLTYPRKDNGELENCKMYNLEETDWETGNYSTWVDDTSRNVTDTCPNGWIYDTDVYASTIVSQWDLVCSKAWQRSMASSIFFAGRLAGAFLSGQASDRWGRRPVFLCSVILQALAGCIAAMSPALWFFYILYFLQGVFQVAVYLSVYVLGTELVGPRYRKLAGMSSNFFYAIGQMILAALAVCIRHWRWIEVAISLPVLLFISYYWLMPESIRWLLSVGKRDEAANILTKVSQMNKVDLDRKCIEQIELGTQGQTKHYTVLDILKHWKLAVIAINVWFNWFANALVYYGLNLNTSNLAGDPYLNFFIAACVEIPSLILALLLLDRIGRKRVYIILLLIAAAGCISTAFVPKEKKVLVVALAMIGKFGATGSYGVIYLMAAEVFPTVVRNVGVGMSSVFSRVGGILAPQVVLFQTVNPSLPQFIFGGLAVVAALSGIALPETAGKKLAQDLNDNNSMSGLGPAAVTDDQDQLQDTQTTKF